MRLKKLLILLPVLCLLACGVKNNGSGKEEKKEKIEISDVATEAVADASGPAGSGIESDTEDPDAVIFAFICGEVQKPGVYEIKTGSRKVELLECAGGFTERAATDVVNLAEQVNDGDMVYIPSKEEAASGEYKAEDEKKDSLVNINKADAAALSKLPGIGETRAEAIIKYRKKHGDFKKTEDIMNVSGIGEATYHELEDWITV